MNTKWTPSLRGAVVIGTLIAGIGLSRPAWAGHTAAGEVGRWVGFIHQSAQTEPSNRFILDLGFNPGTTGIGLMGTINGLPAVQSPVSLVGFVTPFGRLILYGNSGDNVVLCDGSVRTLMGYGSPDGPDLVADIRFGVFNSLGLVATGQLGGLHLFGGLDWASVQPPSVLGGAKGSAIAGGDTTSGPASVFVDSEVGSALMGSMMLGTQRYAMVGTINGGGSTVMMCDGSVIADPTQPPQIIGVLFSGAVSPVGDNAQEMYVGSFGTGPAIGFLPAVQRSRPGAMSFLIGLL